MASVPALSVTPPLNVLPGPESVSWPIPALVIAKAPEMLPPNAVMVVVAVLVVIVDAAVSVTLPLNVMLLAPTVEKLLLMDMALEIVCAAPMASKDVVGV